MTQTIPDEKQVAKFSDEQLWELLRGVGIPWSEDFRLNELIKLSKQGILSSHEQSELESLIDTYDKHVLLRSQVLLHLKQRGYDVEKHLKLI